VFRPQPNGEFAPGSVRRQLRRRAAAVSERRKRLRIVAPPSSAVQTEVRP